MKVALVNPPYGTIKEECCHGPVNELIVPSQICLATAYLRSKNIDADLIEMGGKNLTLQKIDFSGYDIAVVWCSLVKSVYDDIKILKKAKENGLKTIMILNDPYEGCELELMQKFEFIDYCVRLYERELILEKLIKSIGNKKEPSFPGIMVRKKGNVKDFGKVPFISTANHLVSCEEILEELPLKRYEYAFLTTGRGCLFSCTFCFYGQTGCRRREIKNVVNEFKILSDNVKSITCLDYDMLTDKKWTVEFSNELVKMGNQCEWTTDARAEQCDVDTLKSMSRAGLKRLTIGVESADEEILKKIKKFIDLKTVEKSAQNCHKADVLPGYAFMLGFPWDSQETMKKYPVLVNRLLPCAFQFIFAMPIRGTVLYDQCRELKLIKELTVEDYCYSRDEPLYDTLYMKKEELKSARQKIYGDIYKDSKYISWKMKQLIKKPSHGLKIVKKIIQGRHEAQ
jgi:anaerobic magnesium-protoporphyrin IX monomethyl ester cyclase